MVGMGMAVTADTAFLLLALGAAAVMLEFIRPGMVVPGVAGASAMTLGAWAFWAQGAELGEVHRATALAAGIPVVAAALVLAYFAWRARRNKRAVKNVQVG